MQRRPGPVGFLAFALPISWYHSSVNETRIAKFEYTSRSNLLIGFFGIFAAALLIAAWLNPLSFSLWMMVLVILFVSFNVSAVTVQADREIIQVSYGIGLWQKTILVSEIAKLRLRKNNTVFAVFQNAADQALEVTERSGRKTTIGIGETKKMLEFFRGQARGE